MMAAPGSGWGVKTVAVACAAATPTADVQGTAEEVGPNLKAIVAVLFALGQGTDESCRFRKKWKLDWSGPGRDDFATFGHRVARSVTRTRAECWSEHLGKLGFAGSRPGSWRRVGRLGTPACYIIKDSVSGQCHFLMTTREQSGRCSQSRSRHECSEGEPPAAG